MILPEDTKAPIPSDDEFEYQDEYEYEEEYSPYDYDFDSSSPREPRPFVPYTDDPEPYPFDNTDADGDSDAIAHNAGRGDELQYPASPRSTLPTLYSPTCPTSNSVWDSDRLHPTPLVTRTRGVERRFGRHGRGRRRPRGR